VILGFSCGIFGWVFGVFLLRVRDELCASISLVLVGWELCSIWNKSSIAVTATVEVDALFEGVDVRQKFPEEEGVLAYSSSLSFSFLSLSLLRFLDRDIPSAPFLSNLQVVLEEAKVEEELCVLAMVA